MKVLIIEDEAPAARRLINMVTEINDRVQILDIIDSVETALEWFNTHEWPDLVLSDIQLSDDLSFNIFNQLPRETPIIFTTAYDQYAIQAFEHHSIDYLLKPIRKEALEKALDKFENRRFEPSVPNLKGLLEQLSSDHFRNRFLVYAGENLIPVLVKDIAYFKSEDGGVDLHTKEGKYYAVRDSLDTLESQLDPTQFFRANRSYIISVDAIATLKSYFNQKLRLTVSPAQDEPVIISKSKAPLLKKWLDR